MINAVREYFKALTAFNNCPTTFSSCMPKDKKIIDKYFASKKKLMKAIEQNNCEGTLTDICNNWLKAHKDADKCCELVSRGKSIGASRLMQLAGLAEAEMAHYVRAEYESPESVLERNLPNLKKGE